MSRTGSITRRWRSSKNVCPSCPLIALLTRLVDELVAIMHSTRAVGNHRTGESKARLNDPRPPHSRRATIYLVFTVGFKWYGKCSIYRKLYRISIIAVKYPFTNGLRKGKRCFHRYFPGVLNLRCSTRVNQYKYLIYQ